MTDGAQARQGLSERAARWLEEERGLSVELAAEMGVSSRGDQIIFEYRRNGELQWVQHRVPVKDGESGQLSKTFRTLAPDHKRTLKEAGIALSFWNEDALCDPTSPEAVRVITEGQFDAVAIAQVRMGLLVGSVPNGAVDRPGEGDIDPANDARFQYLWEGPDVRGRYKLRGGLAGARKIILATDGDNAGLVLRDELAVRLGRTRCWYVTYPEGCKDANEVLLRRGEQGVRALIDSARPVVPDRLVSFAEVPRRAGAISYDPGWPGFGEHFNVCPPQLIIVTGKPNVGKSEWTLSLVANLARCHGLAGSILNFEDNPERHRDALLRYARAWRTGTTGNQNSSRSINGDPESWVNRMFKTISPSENIEDDYNLAWLEDTIGEAAARHGHKWVLIDPWNEVEHMWGRQDTEATYLNGALRTLKKLSRLYDIAIIIVAHPTKEGGKSRLIEEADLYDVSGGQAWNNKADLGVVVWAEDVSSRQRVIKVCKSRDFDRMGIPGKVQMTFDPVTRVFSMGSPAAARSG